MKKTLITALVAVGASLSAMPAQASYGYGNGWPNPDYRDDYSRGQTYGAPQYVGREYRDDRRDYRDDRGGPRDRDFRDGQLLMECSGIMSRFGEYNNLFGERVEDRMDRMQARFAEESGRLAPRATRRERERWFASGVRRADQITRRSSQRGLIIEDLLRDNLRVEMRRCRDIYRGES